MLYYDIVYVVHPILKPVKKHSGVTRAVARCNPKSLYKKLNPKDEKLLSS